MQCKFSILLRCCDCAQAKSALLLKNGSNLSSQCFIFLEQCNCTNATLFIAKTPDKVGNTSTRPPGHLRLSPTLGCVVQLGASRFAPRARYPDVWQRPAACGHAGPHHHSLLIQTHLQELLRRLDNSRGYDVKSNAAQTSFPPPSLQIKREKLGHLKVVDLLRAPGSNSHSL